MKIAQFSPLFESVPPKLYGGTERVVNSLTEELIRRGHEVTLFASGDSMTSARLVAPRERALRLDPTGKDGLATHVLSLQKLASMADEFDLIHFHTDYLHFPIARYLGIPHVTTIHSRMDNPEWTPVFSEFSELPLVSISQSQQTPMPFVNWMGTVYHGFPIENFEFNEKPGRYLVFLGRISPEKRPDRAIDIAIKSGIPLKIAAKIGEKDAEYFEQKIRPMMHHPLIEFIGEIGEASKRELLGNAKALLFPIDWPEPFGLVMIESLACGTPVIAYPNGSVPEIIEHGKTGFVVDSIYDAVAAVENLSQISRKECRQQFETRFSAERMTKDYLEIYERIIEQYRNSDRERKFKSDSKVAEVRWPDLRFSQLPFS